MTDSALPDEADPSQGPAPVALLAAMALVTRYRLRLTHSGDSRLSTLAPDYQVGAALWTGKRAAFAGFFEPAPNDPTADLERRVIEAAAWGTARLTAQPAERCDILLVSLGPVPAAMTAPADLDQRVRISVIAVDVVAGDATELLGGAGNLPAVKELRGFAKAIRDGARAPTLAAVDLAERETVRGGYVQPARSALNQTPYVTYGLIAMWVTIWLIERVLVHTAPTVSGRTEFTSSLTTFDFGTLIAGPGLPFVWWRIVAAGFVHAFDTPTHVALNSFAMYIFGRNIEQLYGRLAALGSFLICSIGSSLFIWLLVALSIIPGTAVVGASGGIVGLLGMMLVLGRFQGQNLPAGLAAALRRQATTNLALVAVYSIFLGGGITAAVGLGAGISWEGHLGGFLTGAALGCVLPPMRGVGGRDLQVYEKAVLLAVMVFSAAALAYGAYHVITVASGLAAPSILG